jgi:hypothetical protein
MGGVFAKALGRLVGKQEMRILMVRLTPPPPPFPVLRTSVAQGRSHALSGLGGGSEMADGMQASAPGH